jgi:LysM repeat protein
MKQCNNYLLVLLFAWLASPIWAAVPAYVLYDATYMDKFEYEVENLSAQRQHIAYHIYLSATEKIVLNLSTISQNVLDEATARKVIAPTQVRWGKDLVQTVNSGDILLYLVFKKDGAFHSFAVSGMAHIFEDADKLIYSSPYYSFQYDKTKNYVPGADLPVGTIDAYNDLTVFMENGSTTRDCFRQFNTIKVIKETHPKTSFTMIADGDFTKLKTNELYELCQSALYVDYVENVGITEERTKNGRITLVSVNDKKTEQYLAELCETPVSYEAPIAAKPAETAKPSINFNTRTEENTAKSGDIAAAPKTETTVKNNNVTLNKEAAAMEYVMVFEMAAEPLPEAAPQAAATPQATSKGGKTKVVHIVDTGDTLYSIAKKYNVSLLEIQRLNNLPDAQIKVTQELVIYQ